MLALQINRYNTAHLSPKDALRAHVDQLSPAKQREFIAVALQLIVARPNLEKLEATATYSQSLHCKRGVASH